MKYKILGWVGVIWGGLILVNFALTIQQGVTGAYGLGRLVATGLGALLFYAGLRALRRG